MAQHIELNPISHITVGTVGEPGNRVFYLQGSKGSNLISLVIEKQQAAMLVDSFRSLLDEIRDQIDESSSDDTWTADTRLRQPLEVLFRVGNMGLGYSEEARRIVLVAYELVEEGEEPNVVSFWASPAQVRALIPHIRSVVNAGRPICGNCGEPINTDGHFCPRRNGHLH